MENSGLKDQGTRLWLAGAVLADRLPTAEEPARLSDLVRLPKP